MMGVADAIQFLVSWLPKELAIPDFVGAKYPKLSYPAAATDEAVSRHRAALSANRNLCSINSNSARESLHQQLLQP